MEILITTIFTQYFVTSRCIVVITDKNNVLDAPANIPIVNIDLGLTNFSQRSHILFNYFGCQEFILKLSNPVSVFRDIELEIKKHMDRFNSRKYVFVPADQENENIFKIFETEALEYVSNLLVIHKENKATTNERKRYKILNSTDNNYNLWTHKYVGSSGNQEPYLLDKWFSKNSSFIFNNNLFPEKIKNQQGRSLRSAVFQYEPYVIVEPQADQSYNYMGSEMLTMLTFAQQHNMTMVPVINELYYWGEVWDNFSGNGLMGNIVEDNADVGGAALYTWGSMYKFLDLSKPTVQTGITCLVPAPKLAAGWLIPLYAYTRTTWLAVIVTYLVSVLSIYFNEIIQTFSKHKTLLLKPENESNIRLKIFGKAIMCVSKPFVSQNVTQEEILDGQLGRYLMGLVFMTILILSSTYQSGLATTMTIPRYENAIKTVDEFVASGLHWGATQDAWISSIKEAEEVNVQEKYKKIVSRFVATSEEKLREYSLRGKFAFSVERLPRDNYAVGPYIKEDVVQNFNLMIEDFYWEQCVLMTRKNSVLLPYLDIFILRAFEAGLISFWQNEAATQYMDQYVQKAVKYLYYHQMEHITVTLKIVHLAGAFGILCAGIILASITFSIELIQYNFLNNGNSIAPS